MFYWIGLKFKQLVRKDMNVGEHERLTIQYVYICFLGVKFASKTTEPLISLQKGWFYKRVATLAVDCSFSAE